MPMINPFDVFSIAEISDSINNIPNTYGRVGQLGLFPVKGVTTRQIAVEERNGSLALIPTERAGNPGGGSGPGYVNGRNPRKVRTFRVPLLSLDDFCGPEEVQGIRAFGGDGQEQLATLLNDKLADARAKHDITLEHLRMGALKGVILDADGSTLYDLYDEFDITAKTVDFVLGTATTNVRQKTYEVARHIEDNLLGEISNGIHALVSPEFFDKLIDHAKVKETWQNWQEAAERLGGDVRKGFKFGAITFEEYRAVSTDSAGDAIRFIAANEGHAFPTGTANTFRTYVAPADFNETVGKLGQLYYAKTQEAKFARGWDIHTQSNPLPLTLRPSVLVKVHTSN